MSNLEIKALIIDAISEIQEMSGRSIPEMNDDTRPINGIEGFDSLSGLEAKHVISERLNHEFDEAFNPFVSEDGKRALRIREVAERILKAMTKDSSKGR